MHVLITLRCYTNIRVIYYVCTYNHLCIQYYLILFDTNVIVLIVCIYIYYYSVIFRQLATSHPKVMSEPEAAPTVALIQEMFAQVYNIYVVKIQCTYCMYSIYTLYTFRILYTLYNYTLYSYTVIS